jgi:hypothetical protein
MYKRSRNRSSGGKQHANFESVAAVCDRQEFHAHLVGSTDPIESNRAQSNASTNIWAGSTYWSQPGRKISDHQFKSSPRNCELSAPTLIQRQGAHSAIFGDAVAVEKQGIGMVF